MEERISATEIERQATQIDAQAERFAHTCDRVYEALWKMGQIINSEDSNLANVLGQYSTTYQNIGKLGLEKFQQLSEIMHKYVSSTIQNETNTQETVSNYNNDLSEINSILSSINTDINA